MLQHLDPMRLSLKQFEHYFTVTEKAEAKQLVGYFSTRDGFNKVECVLDNLPGDIENRGGAFGVFKYVNEDRTAGENLVCLSVFSRLLDTYMW